MNTLTDRHVQQLHDVADLCEQAARRDGGYLECLADELRELATQLAAVVDEMAAAS